MTNIRLPIGIENFPKMRTENCYYIDKSYLIKELLDRVGEVNLFTRPRRFGKSLNMSMIKSFFEIGTDPSLFDGLAISKETQLCRDYMGKYPVIFLSLKDVKGLCFDDAKRQLWAAVQREAARYDGLQDSVRLNPWDKETFLEIRKGKGNLEASLDTMSRIIRAEYGQKVIILIDEYDVPLQKAKANGYYREMSMLISSFFSYGMKDNDNMQFAVVTGCMRMVKEIIFTGFNNPKMYTLIDSQCAEFFGFTDAEVRRLLDDLGLSEHYQLTKEWYDGYRIGDVKVYNPWDVVNWCDRLLDGAYAFPQNYWANSSSNADLRYFIGKMGDGVTKLQMEKLVAGETVSRPINQELTYGNMYDSIENVWGIMFTTGYLTQCGTVDGRVYDLAIPNMEVRSIFTEILLDGFRKNVSGDGAALKSFCEALLSGDAPEVERLLLAYLKKTISIRDTAIRNELKENFYHGILLGILAYKSDWDIGSNRESGDGYGDILIEAGEEETGIVIEVKYAEGGQMDKACEQALAQIRARDYEERLRRDDMTSVLRYGISFYKKQCRVAVERGYDAA